MEIAAEQRTFFVIGSVGGEIIKQVDVSCRLNECLISRCCSMCIHEIWEKRSGKLNYICNNELTVICNIGRPLRASLV